MSSHFMTNKTLIWYMFAFVLFSSARCISRSSFAYSTSLHKFIGNRSLRLKPVLSAKLCTHTSTTEHVSNVDTECTTPITPVDYSHLKAKKTFKVRQHVNPLASAFQQPVVLEKNWLQRSFANMNPKEFIVDIGCAKGSWALTMCENNPDINILGLEIRAPMVENCMIRKVKKGIQNVHFLSCNANVNVRNILSSINEQGIKVNTITMQFPDPQFKERHKKRRLVNSIFVNDIASSISKDTQIFLQSDVEELILDMVSHFNNSIYFTPVNGYNIFNLHENISPFPIKTEREIATLAQTLPVYRMLFKRNDVEIV